MKSLTTKEMKMSEQAKHTPTPWKATFNDGLNLHHIIMDDGRNEGNGVALVSKKDDVEFILRAVNNIERIEKERNDWQDLWFKMKAWLAYGTKTPDHLQAQNILDLMNKLEQALSQAKEE